MPPPAGRWVTAVSVSTTRVRSEHDAMEDGAGAAIVHYRHVQRLWVSQAELTVARGLGHGLGAELRVPLRHVTSRIRFEDAAGQPFAPREGFLHHRNETLLKPSDPWLLLHGGVVRGAWSFGARAGVALPVGRTEPDPIALPSAIGSGSATRACRTSTSSSGPAPSTRSSASTWRGGWGARP
jgi:hypothetical protein